jgi:hypothetical protein
MRHMSEVSTGEVTAARRTTPRSILAALFWLLACLAILVGGVTLWAHQTVLTANGWGTIVARVAADPEVIAATSERVVDRVSQSLDISGKVAQILPGDMNLLSGAITRVVQQKVADGLATVAATKPFQDAFVAVNEKAHDAAMKVIRGGESKALTSSEGAITLDVFPLIGSALTGLQEAGIIPADVQLPDLTNVEPDPQRVATLEKLLGRDLPADIGTITLVQSDRLATVQQAVRAFDVITVVVLIAAALFVALALWLSARRLRMVVWLAIGAIVALLLGRFVTRIVIEDVTGALRDGENGATVMGVVNGAVDSLLWFTFLLIVVALVVALVAVLVERRAAISEIVAEPDGVRAWLRSRSRAIAYVGIGLVAFVVLWNLGGPDITFVAGALVGLLLIALAVIGGHEPKSGEAAS